MRGLVVSLEFRLGMELYAARLACEELVWLNMSRCVVLHQRFLGWERRSAGLTRES